MRLIENDPATVMSALSAAFEDNITPVAPAGADGVEALLVVLNPHVDAVPDRFPTVTDPSTTTTLHPDAGNLSIRKMRRR